MNEMKTQTPNWVKVEHYIAFVSIFNPYTDFMLCSVKKKFFIHRAVSLTQFILFYLFIV